MPDPLWLLALAAQACLLAAYRQHRIFPWWMWSLVPGIVFSPIIYALPADSWPRWWAYVAYQVIRSVLTIAAVLEARDAMTTDAQTKRFATKLGLIIAAGWCGYRVLTTPGTLCNAVLIAAGGISATLFGVMLAVIVWQRVVSWPLRWPASVHLPLLLALMLATVERSRFMLGCVAVAQAIAAAVLWKRKRPAV